MIRIARRLLGVACLALVQWSCGSTSEVTSTPTLATVTVALVPSTIQVGQSAIATATGVDQNAASISVGSVTWSSGSPQVATVSASGIISAVAVGQTTITATAGGKQGTATLTVQPITTTATDFAITGVQFTQGVQVADGSIPMVLSGDAAAVNVLIRATPSRAASMQVVLRIFDATGALIRTDTAVTTGVLSASPTYDAPTVQFLVPAAVLKPGLKWQVVRDPKGLVPDDSPATDVYPSSGTMPLATVGVPPLNIRFVPITLASNGNATGNVTATNIPQYLRTLYSVHPLGVVNAHVGTPIVTNASFGTAPTGGAAGFWQQLIGEIDLARIADPVEPDANWYGVVVPPNGFNFTTYGGFSYIPTSGTNTGPGTRTSAAVQINWFFNPTQARDLVAHEIGHTFGRSHAPCGAAGAPLDASYPTAGGTLEQAGHDVFGWVNGFASSAVTIPASSGDVMGYCNPVWASSYTYRAVMAFRGTSIVASRVPEPVSRVLVVRGSVVQGKSVSLEPAFVLNARPSVQESTGDYILKGLDADGQVLFSVPFTPFVLDHAPDVRPFTIALPSNADLEARLVSIVVRGAAGVARLDSPASAPATNATDARTSTLTRSADGAYIATCGDAGSRGIVVLAPDGSVVGSAPGASMRLSSESRSSLSIVCSDGVRTKSSKVAAQF